VKDDERKPTPSRTEVRRASAHVFELLLDAFPDIIWSVDAEGRLVFVNRKATELLGYSLDELLGMSIRQLYAPEILDQVDAGFKNLQKKGRLSGIESILISKSGERIPVEIRSFAVYDQSGKFLRTFSILRDIRDIKELQNSLIHASRLAALGELAACVAHDISNPLSVVRLYAEMLQMHLDGLGNTAPAAAMRDAVDAITKSAEVIERIVNHLREFCRSTGTEKEEIVDLRFVIEDALFMVKNKIEKMDVSIQKQFPESPCFVRGHSSELEQVFMNLISNACDAMEDAPEPTIWIRIRQDEHTNVTNGPAVVCDVTDCGKGIPPEQLDKIFKSFFTTKPKGKGTGLGLAITRNIVRRHGGDILVSSEVGKGTTFSVILPRFSGEPG